jgi:hypothetical protein
MFRKHGMVIPTTTVPVPGHHSFRQGGHPIPRATARVAPTIHGLTLLPVFFTVQYNPVIHLWVFEVQWGNCNALVGLSQGVDCQIRACE